LNRFKELHFVTEGFTVTLMIPDDYRDFIAEIQYDQKYLCTITQELGSEMFSVEFDQSSLHVPLAGFLEAIEYAQERLIEFRKTVE